MQLTLHARADALLVRAHEPGAITVGERVLRSPFVVCGQSILEDWTALAPRDFTTDDAERLLALPAEIVVVGAPLPFGWPRASVRARFGERRVGFEIMETGAACRTYNVLVQEDRKVAAVLYP